MQNNNINSCPVCGATNITTENKKISIKCPFGPEETKIIGTTYKCGTCESVFGDDTENDKKIENVLDICRRKSIGTMLNVLQDNGYSLAAIERALELPQRTISRWKSSTDLSSMGVALLRIISTFPWILQVAENKYKPAFAKRIYLNNAIPELLEIAFNGLNTINHAEFISRKEFKQIDRLKNKLYRSRR